jgi:hypothetical protein
MRHILKTYSILLLLALPALALAQDRISFTAMADAKQMVLNDYLGVSFVLRNANGTDLQLPKLKAFKVISGPNTSSSTTNINGQWERTITYTYYFEPLRKGKHTIGAATIKVDKKTYRTKPFTVEVLPKANNTVSEDKKLFLKAEVNTTEAVPGQAVVLDYKAYFAVDVDHFNIAEEPDYSGFFVSDIRRFNAQIVKEVIDGVPYRTRIIKRLVLYPQQVGQLTVGPMSIRMAVPMGEAKAPDPRDPFSFLSSRTRPTRQYIVTSEPVQINVRSLPDPIPNTFSGAVGKYTATSSTDRTYADTDGAVTLQLTLAGNGDIKRVTAPELILSDTFEVYEPKLADERQGEQDGELFGTKTFNYLLLPKYPGVYNIKPSISYYQPDSSKFVTLTTGSHTVHVKKGKHSSNLNVNTVEVEKPKREIRGIKVVSSTKEKKKFLGSPLFWILLGSPLLLWGGGWLWQFIQARRPEVDPIEEKSKKAQKVAKEKLAQAKKFLKAGDERAFFDETSKALIGYVSDKYNIPGSELTKRNVQGKLEASGANKAHISRFMELLNTCEVAVFAYAKTNAAADTYQAAASVIVDIEKTAA